MPRKLTAVRAFRRYVLEGIAVGLLADAAHMNHQRLPAEFSRVRELGHEGGDRKSWEHNGGQRRDHLSAIFAVSWAPKTPESQRDRQAENTANESAV